MMPTRPVPKRRRAPKPYDQDFHEQLLIRWIPDPIVRQGKRRPLKAHLRSKRLSLMEIITRPDYPELMWEAVLREQQRSEKRRKGIGKSRPESRASKKRFNDFLRRRVIEKKVEELLKRVTAYRELALYWEARLRRSPHPELVEAVLQPDFPQKHWSLQRALEKARAKREVAGGPDQTAS